MGREKKRIKSLVGCCVRKSERVCGKEGKRFNKGKCRRARGAAKAVRASEEEEEEEAQRDKFSFAFFIIKWLTTV